jgi:hypothetical protein
LFICFIHSFIYFYFFYLFCSCISFFFSDNAYIARTRAQETKNLLSQQKGLTSGGGGLGFTSFNAISSGVGGPTKLQKKITPPSSFATGKYGFVLEREEEE